MTLFEKIVGYMKRHNLKIERDKNVNIVYVEGIDADGKLNLDLPNQWNDLRIVFFIDEHFCDGIAWNATTEPGKFYTDNPMNPKGAARIAFGQYKAWRVGVHGNSEPHEALIQVAPVKVFRDYNRDMIRIGDKAEEGLFGINQHHGYDYSSNNIGKAGAGCLVGRTRKGHKEFMDLIKQDVRYKKDRNFIFMTTIIPGDKL